MVAWGLGRELGKGGMGQEETFGSDGYVHYLDYSDGFICQIIEFYTAKICSLFL